VMLAAIDDNAIKIEEDGGAAGHVQGYSARASTARRKRRS
jgi:hypothetical protein